MLRDKLPVILVGRHHQHLEPFLFGLLGNCTDDIVRLVMRHLQHRNTVCRDDFANVRDGNADIFRRFFPLRFVGFISLVTKRRTGRIETESDMRRGLAPKDIFERIDETEDCRRVHPFRVHSGGFDESVIRTVNERVSVD